MEHHVSWLTQFVNHYLGAFATFLLSLLHIQPTDRATPIPEHVVMSLVVFLLAVVVVLWMKPRLSAEKPGAVQQVAEMLLTNPLGFGIRDSLEENVAHGAEKFVPMVGSVAVFVLLSNLLGVVPALSSPTGEKSVPLGCALITFVYFNYLGIRQHGPIGYAKTLAGPVWWLAWLILPVELISTCARVLSLTVRLWANMFSSELIYGIFLGMLVGPVDHIWGRHPVAGVVLGIFPALIPIAFIGLHIFVAVIQTYVFTVLPSIYVGMAIAEEH
jgi:F-type H+-transporting ATPase subunit a